MRRLLTLIIAAMFVQQPPTTHADEAWYSDCDLDLEDLARMQNCFLPSARPPLAEECQSLDFDLDEDLDGYDYAIFREAMSGPDTPFNYAPSPLPDSEAEQLALETRATLKVDLELYERISNDLRAIREQFPDECTGPNAKMPVCIPAIHHVPRSFMDELSVTVFDHEPQQGYQDLNCFFGVTEYLYHQFNGRSNYILYLPAKINAPTVARMYTALPEVKSAFPDGLIGDIPSITVAMDRFNPGWYRYTIRFGWGFDCQAGCKSFTVWEFAVSESGLVVLVSRRGR